jgi:hypothetical protein
VEGDVDHEACEEFCSGEHKGVRRVETRKRKVPGNADEESKMEKGVTRAWRATWIMRLARSSAATNTRGCLPPKRGAATKYIGCR